MPPASEMDSRWFDGKPEDLAPLVRRLESNLSYSRFIDGAITRLYFGEGILPVGATSPTSAVPAASTYLRALDALTQENVVKAVLDAAASMIVRPPAYKVITTGSVWKKQIAARRMSRLLTGLFTSSGLEGDVTPIFLDSCRCQVAASKWVVDESGKVTCGRVLPHTLIWNPAEGPRPRNMFQRHGLPRTGLMARFPELARKIRELPPYRPDAAFHIDVWQYMTDRDHVEVFEGWRLPEGDDPGRYVMTIGNIVAADQEWDLPVSPIVPLTFGDSYATFAGDPLGKQILPYQLTVNRMNRSIDEHHVKCVSAKVFMPKGAEVQGWDNAIGSIVYYNASAGKPEIMQGTGLPPEFYRYKDSVKAAAFELAGVSYSIGSGTKEAGLNSGRAQRERFDIANSRLVLHAQRLERWFEANGRVAMALMRKAYGDNKDLRVRAPNTKMLEEIDWSQVGDIREDEIEVRAYITSAIPLTPAARAETLSERVDAGVMTARRASRWYADPDLARLEEEDSATEDLVLKMIDSALEDGEYIQPEPVLGADGLQMLIDQGGKELMKALCMKSPPPDANMELLRRLIEEAQLLLQSMPPAAAPAPSSAAPPPEQQAA